MFTYSYRIHFQCLGIDEAVANNPRNLEVIEKFTKENDVLATIEQARKSKVTKGSRKK